MQKQNVLTAIETANGTASPHPTPPVGAEERVTVVTQHALANDSHAAWVPLATNAACLFTVLLGCAGFAGWAFRLPLLRTVLHGLPEMVPNTAAGFVLAGLALCGFRRECHGRVTQRLARVFALVVTVFGVLTVGEYLFDWDAGLDHGLFSEAVAQHETVLPGRPAVLTAVNFALLGLALLLLDVRTPRGRKPAEWCAVTAILISLLGLIGYVCQVPSFYGWKTLFANAGMALSTVTGMAVLGAGVLCARPSGGLMEIVTSRTASGSMARRLLLAPVVIPLVTGWIRMMGGRIGFYNNELGVWFLSFLNIFVFTLFIWGSARLLFRAETMRRRAEEDLKALNSKLEESNRELEAFAYSVSHDLRAPLRHLSGFVQVLREDLTPVITEGSRHSLDVITDSAARMGLLIDNLLAFSQMSRAELRLARVEMEPLVGEVLREVQTETNGRVIDWEIGSLPEVFGDRALLKQVWLNLLSNAIKYTRKREQARIRIGAHDRTDEVEFFVEDNGAGFNMRHVDKLFGVFQRLHRAEEFEGTGIGLANVRRIVARHGGRTWAKGEVDAGAAFYFTLPKRAGT